MAQIKHQSSAEPAQTLANTPGAQELVEETAKRLEDNESLELFEGSMTGALYTEAETGFLKLQLKAGTPSVTAVPQPREDMEPLVQIEPSGQETIEDAVGSITYTGGD